MEHTRTGHGVTASNVNLLAGSGSTVSQVPQEPYQKHIQSGEQPERRSLRTMDVQTVELSDAVLRGRIVTLLSIINKRLSIMPEMAQLKMTLGEELYNKAREEVVMASSLQIAKEIGLDEELARHFVQGQMDAAKKLQAKYETPSGLSVDAANQRKSALRADLITMNREILTALNAVQGDLDIPRVQAEIANQMATIDGHLQDKEVRDEILRALKPVAHQD